MSENTPQITEIKLHQKSRLLEVSYADGKTFALPCEFLRVHSPSAEVAGHGPGQEVLQVGKQNVEITEIAPVGNYGINIQMISTSEIKISVVVDEKYLELAVRVLHKAFELEQA